MGPLSYATLVVFDEPRLIGKRFALEPDELLRGIRAAARGDSPLDPRAAHAVLTRETVGAALTTREREVPKLVANGLPNKQIARALGITEKTVKAHIVKIFAAIGVTDRTAEPSGPTATASASLPSSGRAFRHRPGRAASDRGCERGRDVRG